MPLHLRSGTVSSAAAVLAAGLLFGCGDDSGGVEALFEVPREAGEGEFYALPFPNDIRVAASGEIDLSSHERPNPLSELYIDSVSQNQRGFSLNAPALFRFAAPLDSGSLPQTPEQATLETASVYLVNIEAGSPRYGERVPARFRFVARKGTVIGENWLSVLPFPGFPLAESSVYAAVVTSRVRAADGSGVSAADDFRAIRDENSPSDSLAAAALAYQPLWDYLDDDGGDERDDVVSAAVFTTQDATSVMGRIREVIYRDVAAPTPRDLLEIETNAEYTLYEGVYDGPIFQRGTIPYARPEDGGDLEIDANGDPVVQASVELRFALTVPTGVAPPAGWPLVIYAHGTGGSYRSFVNNSTATHLARQGLAAVSIDQTLHGPRNPNGNPELDYFNFQNPLSARDNTIQGALDDFQLARMMVDFDESLGGADVSFDTDRFYFFGHSQGGLTGIPFVAYEPLIKGAVFSGSGGNIVLSLLNKTLPIDIAGLIQLLIRDDPLDEFNPMLGLIQGYVDRSDSINFGRLMVTAPPEGRAPINVFHSLGLTDNFTPVPSIKALATSMSLDPLEPLIEPIDGLVLRGREAVTAPLSDNLDGVTGVVAQYNQAPGSDGHFVVFDIASARLQSIEFLGSLARDGVATVVAPGQ